MKKENYCKLVVAIKKRREDDLSVTEKIRLFIDLPDTFQVAEEFVESVMDVMRSATGDNDGWLDWWLDGGRYVGIGNGDVLLATPGDLFDFLNGDL